MQSSANPKRYVLLNDGAPVARVCMMAPQRAPDAGSENADLAAIGVDKEGISWFAAWLAQEGEREIIVHDERSGRPVAHGSFVIREAGEAPLIGAVIERPTMFVLRTVVDRWDYGPG